MDRDPALIERLEHLYPAVVADCLDRLGLRAQVLDPGIRPLYADAKVAGYAATVHCVEVDAVPASRDDWYRGEMAAVDALEPGDVMVVSASAPTGASCSRPRRGTAAPGASWRTRTRATPWR